MATGTSTPVAARLHPVEALKQHIVSLDAAMLVAVTAAEVSAVHKLRTGTRRVEAMMHLLDVLGSGSRAVIIADHTREADAVRRRLRRLRRAAGAVRDLDVQTETIWYDAPAKAAVHEGSPGERMRKQAKQLRKHLKAKRETEAEKLVTVLKAEEQKVAASLRALEQVLEPASKPAITHATLTRRVKRWFAGQVQPVLQSKKSSSEPLQLAIERLTEEELHTVRKAAKLCRYMAESCGEHSEARGAAEQFEALQEAGGTWHDWLLLSRISRRFHGAKSELTKRYRKHCEAALAEYHLRLAEKLPGLMKA